jgi:coproporphyrinogen III oxidase-like Fe-S oxidoreductase
VQSSMQQYVDVVCREIKATGTMGTQGLKSVFFGGGTPSLLPPHMLQQILQVLKDHLGWARQLRTINIRTVLTYLPSWHAPLPSSLLCFP